MELIENEIISEWADFYIDYKTLKQILENETSDNTNNQNEEIKNQNNINNEENLLGESLLSNNEQNQKENEKMRSKGEITNDTINKYFKQLYLEIEKFSFFNDTLQNKRYLKRFEEIIEQLGYIERHKTMYMFKVQLIESLKNFYRIISTYQLFLNTNIKIKNLILNDLNIASAKISIPNLKEKEDEINEVLFSAEKYNKKLLSKIEDYYIKYVHKKENVSAIDELRKFLISDKKSEKLNKEILKVLIIILATIIVLCIFMDIFLQLDMDNDLEFRAVFPLYRTFGIICLYLWTLGVNVWVWNNANINYKALFTFDNHYSTSTEVFIRAAMFSIILFLCLLAYMITRTQTGVNYGLNQYGTHRLIPAIMWICLVLYFFWPFKNFNYYGRIYTMKLFRECIASIMIPIEFKHIWFMDQLTSLIGPMRDIEYTLCYYNYVKNPFQTRLEFCSDRRIIYLIIAIFPNLFRILQVSRQIIDESKFLPYIFNIGKYTFNIIVATFSFLSNYSERYFIYWLITAFISGCYSSFWDLRMDFGYFEPGDKNWPLRDKTKYNRRTLCLIAIPVNIVLRFLWMLSISHEIMQRIIRPEFLALILYTLEMIRRAQWNFIRVEYEHFELEKGYQISYYEELPLIKISHRKFMTNEHNLLNILKIEKRDRIRLELRELFNSLKKDKGNKKTKEETSLSHLKEEKKYAHYIVEQLKQYLETYKQDTYNNLNINS